MTPLENSLVSHDTSLAVVYPLDLPCGSLVVPVNIVWEGLKLFSLAFPGGMEVSDIKG